MSSSKLDTAVTIMMTVLCLLALGLYNLDPPKSSMGGKVSQDLSVY